MKPSEIDLQTVILGLMGLTIILLVGGWFLLLISSELKQAPWQFLSILIAFLSALMAWIYQFQIKIREEQREEKTKLYEEIMEFFFNIILPNRSKKKEMSEEKIQEFFERIVPRLIMWGSDDVVKYFRLFKSQSTVSDKNSKNTELDAIIIYEKLLLSIRRDLGHNNSGISKEKFLLGIFVNDIDTHDVQST